MKEGRKGFSDRRRACKDTAVFEDALGPENGKDVGHWVLGVV